jgi:MinD superfamily P-loop ATPase
MTPASEITAKCTRCGACLEECPTRAIVAGVRQYAIDLDLCDGHGNCIAICPERAIVAAPPKSKGPSRGAKS